MHITLAATLGFFCIGAAAAHAEDKNVPARQIQFVGGVFHGPGNLADSPSPAGTLSHLQLAANLAGRIEFFNNGAQPPNLQSEVQSQLQADGRLSNGRSFNEYTDGGIIEVGRGAMRFLNVTAGDGPTAGITRAYLDADFNWHLLVDLALDPGFAEGVIVIERLDITTGVAPVPPSQQSAAGQLGGTERAGSLLSGSKVVGRFGDFDADGLLDGVFVGATNIPLQHLFMPGAPAVQVRSFVTDIPVLPVDAALLALSSAINLGRVMSGNPAPISALPAQSKSRGAPFADLLKRLDAAVGALKKAPQTQRELNRTELLRSHVAKCAEQSLQPGGCTPDLPQIVLQLSEVRSAVTAMASLQGGDVAAAGAPTPGSL